MTVAMMMDNPAGSQELYAALRAEMRSTDRWAEPCTSPDRAPTAAGV